MTNSGTTRIAERYVKALFEAAQAANALPAVEKDLRALSRALAESAELRQFLHNPLVPLGPQADTMAAIAAKMQAQALTGQFLALLARQKRLCLLPDIVALFARWCERARGEMTGELVTASVLPKADIALVAERLGKAYGKKVTLDVREDPSLLGGMVVKIGSVQIDGSLSGKLARLGLALKAA